MIELEAIKKQIRRMRQAGVEPECVYLTPRASHFLERPKIISGVPVYVETGLLTECEVR